MKERPSELSASGYEPVAVIRKAPEELAAGRQLAFEDGYDDLDSLRECTFAGSSGATFGLVRYAHTPRSGGTQLLVKARSLSQATELLAEAVDALGLTMADLSWIRRELWAGMSAATEKRAAERKTREDAARAQRPGRAKGKAHVAAVPTDTLGALRPSAALAKVIGSGAMSRQEITKKLWSYIKRKGLQDKRNRRMINADDALRPVLGKSQVNMSELPTLVDKHLKSAADGHRGR